MAHESTHKAHSKSHGGDEGKPARTETQVKEELLASARTNDLNDILILKKKALVESISIEEIEAELERRKATV